MLAVIMIAVLIAITFLAGETLYRFALLRRRFDRPRLVRAIAFALAAAASLGGTVYFIIR